MYVKIVSMGRIFSYSISANVLVDDIDQRQYSIGINRRIEISHYK